MNISFMFISVSLYHNSVYYPLVYINQNWLDIKNMLSVSYEIFFLHEARSNTISVL